MLTLHYRKLILRTNSQTHIFSQNFVLIQPRTSPPKICKNLKGVERKILLIFPMLLTLTPNPYPRRTLGARRVGRDRAEHGLRALERGGTAGRVVGRDPQARRDDVLEGLKQRVRPAGLR